MDEEIYGISDNHPWPYEYVISALQLLSLSSENFDKYIPKKTGKMMHDGRGGCVESDSPIILTLSFLIDIISLGLQWDEWIENEKYEDIGIEEKFESLYEIVVSLQLFERKEEALIRERLRNNELDDWTLKLSECRKLSISILKEIGLYEPEEPPFVSWYDAFSA